mmetsp:Transcript_19508/g.33518  ORF Transcript_19508/g.33518 Transcript_19508/m.33518 type:complete len:411 (+) Transcript_19508:39-1271(+)
MYSFPTATMTAFSKMSKQKQLSVVMTVLLAVLCPIGVVFRKQPASNHESKHEDGHQQANLRVAIHPPSKNHRRQLKQVDGDAPMIHLDPVDGHFPWLHIPKTGSSFVNVLIQFACANFPAEEPLSTGGVNHFNEYTSNSEYECSQEYAGIPFLAEDSFHQPVTDAVYQQNKGKLMGMLREPKSHRVSYAKHKFMKHYGSEGWKEYISINGLPKDDKTFKTMLGFNRGFETSFLAGPRHAFRYKDDEEEQREILDEAKHRLTEGFQYIGITNRYPESVCLFYSKFAKPGDDTGTDKSCKPVVFKPVNTAAGCDGERVAEFNFTDADWEYFEDYDDEIDREVYNHALELFEADLVRYGVTRESCIARGCWPEEKDVETEETNEPKESEKNTKDTNNKSSHVHDETGKWENTG